MLEFIVDVSGLQEGHEGIERDVRAATKRIAMLARSLGHGVEIKRTFIINKVD